MSNKKSKKQKALLCAFFYVLGTFLLIYLSAIIDSLLIGNGTDITPLASFRGLADNPTQRSIFLILNLLLLTACVYMAIADFQMYKTNVIKVTDDIYIPVPDGQNQHGSARFMTGEEVEEMFHVEYVDPNLSPFKEMLSYGEVEYKRFKDEALIRHKIEQQNEKSESNAKNKINIFKRKATALLSRFNLRKLDSDDYNIPADDFAAEEENDAIIYMCDLSVENEESEALTEPLDEDEYNRLKDEEYETEIDIDVDQIAAEYEGMINSQDTCEKAKAAMSYFRDTVLSQDKEKKPFEPPFKEGGLVVGMKKQGDIEKWFLHTDDTHNLIVGSTRSGKSRSVVIQSIFAMAMAGESIVITDPKAELFQYTSDFLRNFCDYEVACIDFRNPTKSNRYNLLQPTIDAINRGDVEKAEESAWDLTNILVGDETHGEKIWENGEKATIAGAILSVVYDNRKHPEFQNLTNVYWFVAKMAKEVLVGGRMRSPLEEYAKAQDSNHPASATFAIADVAPGRTKGSFFTSALTTLKLFNMKYMFDITCATDIDIAAVGKSKMALFLILPDEKKTYYPIASLVISQLYELLVWQSDERGGRLKNRVNFLCDEFGNFTKITDFINKLTVAGGRGMRFHLFLQSLMQIEEKYGKETAAIIEGNCETWIYLKTEDVETHEKISKKMGKYTTSAYQISANHSKYVNPQSSHSISLMGRELLMPDEVGRIKRPDQLIIVRGLSSIFRADDLSQWHLNKILALGDKKHNIDLRISREESREKRVSNGKITLWGIWDDIGKVLEDWNIILANNEGKITAAEYELIQKRLRWAATGASREQIAQELKMHHRRMIQEKAAAALIRQKQMEG